MQSFGTDGQEALYRAFQHEFPRSIHLQCSNHVRRNVKTKLQELVVSEHTIQIVLGDIFGRMVEFQHFDGLVDADSNEEYDKGLQSLCQKWESYDGEAKGPFHSVDGLNVTKVTLLNRQCFVQKEGRLDLVILLWPLQQTLVKASMLCSKIMFSARKVMFPCFLTNLKAAIDEQQRELERAIVDKGKYTFKQAFASLVIGESEWFLKMSTIQK